MKISGRILRTRFAVVLACPLCASVAHAAETPMPPAAAGILTQMDKEIDAAKTKAVVSLEKVLKDTTKKGDLAGAMAVKEVIDQLKADSKTVRGGGNAATIVGRWRWNDVVFDFRPDSTVKNSQGTSGRWQMSGNNLEVTWDNGYKYRLSAKPDGWSGIQIAPSGQESNFQLKREQ